MRPERCRCGREFEGGYARIDDEYACLVCAKHIAEKQARAEARSATLQREKDEKAKEAAKGLTLKRIK